jgi:hypothetical protein
MRPELSRQGSRQTSKRIGATNGPTSLVKTGGRDELGNGAGKQVGGITALVPA